MSIKKLSYNKKNIKKNQKIKKTMNVKIVKLGYCEYQPLPDLLTPEEHEKMHREYEKTFEKMRKHRLKTKNGPGREIAGGR